MPYPELLVRPMREELTRVGVAELKSAPEVDATLPQPGTTLVVVNSVCGCAARNARPAVVLALRNETLPDRSVTVFAGQDTEATSRARAYFHGYPPSSPSIALLKDGEIVHMIERHGIEGRDADEIADELAQVFDRYCGAGV
jgi:putative YphP/YqiW family bacilliredoxin